MKILSKNTLPLGGFAGLREHRIVMDSRIFGHHKQPETAEGIGDLVYLADAYFNPKGETGMHPHKEVDVISVMIKGRISHAGSLEDGNILHAGDVQVQRAGGEGFLHNEYNPDQEKNRMIQLWVRPNEQGQAADYRHYKTANSAITHIYGGDKSQSDVLDNQTMIDIIRLKEGDKIQLSGERLLYITAGGADFNEEAETYRGQDGDLIRITDAIVAPNSDLHMIVIGQQPLSINEQN